MPEGKDIHNSFIDEGSRCTECGMFPPDHDPVCPNNPSLYQVTPEDALRELEEKLRELEGSDMPDFEAITDILARIESVKSNVKTDEDSSQ
jgi:hypothetical protein